MRRKLVVLAVLVAATLTASRIHAMPPPEEGGDVCFRCSWCIDGVCGGCVQVACPR
jgi:hypothetical protein